MAWKDPINALYQEALTVYKKPFTAKMALFFTAVAFISPFMFRIMITADAEDYSVLAAWLIIVPITGMALVNYYLVMKPIMRRKRFRYE